MKIVAKYSASLAYQVHVKVHRRFSVNTAQFLVLIILCHSGFFRQLVFCCCYFFKKKLNKNLNESLSDMLY